MSDEAQAAFKGRMAKARAAKKELKIKIPEKEKK